MAQCVLCLRSDRPMTREHVFARWLVIKLRGGRLVPSGAAGADRIGRTITSVCAGCNAGWMSVLEMSYRSAMFGRPRVGVIQPQDRVTLSRWFAKTAILLAQARGGALGGAEHTGLPTGVPDTIEVFISRRRRPPQRLDFAVDAGVDGVRSVSILVDDVVGHVGLRGTLTSRHGTRLWPLRSHTLRWETLPVITSLRTELAAERH